MHAHSTRARASTAPACPGWGPGRPSRPSASEQPWLAGLRVGVGNYSASSISSAWLVQSIRACLCCVVGWLWWVRWHGRGYRQQAVTRSRQGKGQCMHTAPDTACPAARYAPVCETGWYMYAWGASSPGSKDRTLPLSSQKARTHATEAKASDPVWMGVGVGGSGSEAASCESAQTRTRVSPQSGTIDRSIHLVIAPAHFVRRWVCVASLPASAGWLGTHDDLGQFFVDRSWAGSVDSDAVQAPARCMVSGNSTKA